MELNAVINQRIDIAEGAMVIRVVPDATEVPDFRPGQFALLGLPPAAPKCEEATEEKEPPDPERMILRSYSISSPSITKDYVEFYVTLVPFGSLTPRLFALGTGDRLWMSPRPSGFFTLKNVPEEANIAMFATSTGIAPFMSMLRTEKLHRSKRRFALIHGARHSWELPFRSELQALQNQCDNFIYIPIVSRPEEEPVRWKGATGHIQELWQSRSLERIWETNLTPANTHLFLCGNPGMVDEMLAIAQSEGYRQSTNRVPGEVHIERYW
jgi:ferredoxin--NADP+ reductase